MYTQAQKKILPACLSIFLIAITYVFLNSWKDLSSSWQNNVFQPWSVLILILSVFVFSTLMYVRFPRLFILSNIIFSFLIFLVINSLAGRGIDFLLSVGYCVFLWKASSRLIRTGHSIFAIRLISVIILNLFFSILINYFGNLKYATTAASIIGYLTLIRRNTICLKLHNGYPNYLKYFISFGFTSLAALAGFLVNQPIIEWDSSVGHVPTVMHYFYSSSVAGYKFNIQTFLFNFHHIGALPFFSVGDTWGLKFWNFLQILLSFLATVKLIQFLCAKLKIQWNSTFAHLTGLLVISSPLIFTTAGTFQYDVPIFLFFILNLDLLARATSDHVRSNYYFFWILVSAFIACAIKVSFLLTAPAYLAIFLLHYRRVKLNPIKIILLGLFFAIAYAAINQIKSGSLFYPYNYMQNASAKDWQNYGFKNLLIDIPLYIPWITLVSSKFGHVNNLTAGIAPLLGFILSFFLIGEKKYRPYVIGFHIFLILAIIPTRYLRYSVFVWGTAPLFIYPLMVKFKEQKLSPVAIIAALILVLQICLIPSLNWWVKVPGQILNGGYSEAELQSSILGSDLEKITDFKIVTNGHNVLFVSEKFASKYYWINMLYGQRIIPLTWQSGALIPFPKNDCQFRMTLTLFETKFLLLPNSEILNLQLPSFKKLKSNDSFTLLEKTDE